MTSASERDSTGASLSHSQIFLAYYKETDILTSPEGILKIVAVMSCVVTAAVSVWDSECGAGAGGAATALASAAVLALLLALVALRLAYCAPQACLYADVVVSSCSGAALLVSGSLGLALCEARSALHYLRGALSAWSSVAAVGGAALTYRAATRALDHYHARPPHTTRPAELDV